MVGKRTNFLRDALWNHVNYGRIGGPSNRHLVQNVAKAVNDDLRMRHALSVVVYFIASKFSVYVLYVPVEVEGGEGRGRYAQARERVGAGVSSMRQPQEEVFEVCKLRSPTLGEEDVGGGEAAVHQAPLVEELEADERLPRPTPEVTQSEAARGSFPAVLSQEGLFRLCVVPDDVSHGAARHHASYEEPAGRA